jgi:MFS transporter, DHA1 family, quinolone resistance protein
MTTHNPRALRILTCMMFLMFAMTTDAIGTVIAKLKGEFTLSLTAASAVQYATMIGLGSGAIFLGFMADRIGRRWTILLGLLLFGASSLCFILGRQFGVFVFLLLISGLGIAIFKIGALALVGDISTTSEQHTSTMNLIEGFFGTGAIAGPLIVAWLVTHGFSWKWLYVVAAAVCACLMIAAFLIRFPTVTHPAEEQINLGRTLRMMVNPYALGFSLLIMLYVAVENSITVWMPTYLLGYHGPGLGLVAYALTIFFVLRAVGRFFGVWLLKVMRWTTVLVLLSGAILACFLTAMLGGSDAAIYFLPATGLFMSMMYPTLNSKGISCFPRFEHGAVAGVILFFTAVAAALGPWAMAALSDAHGGDIRYAFGLATVLAALLFAGLLYNWWRDPAERRLQALRQA